MAHEFRVDSMATFYQGVAGIPNSPLGTFCAAQVAAAANKSLGGFGSNATLKNWVSSFGYRMGYRVTMRGALVTQDQKERT
jgi:hypothetical protein